LAPLGETKIPRGPAKGAGFPPFVLFVRDSKPRTGGALGGPSCQKERWGEFFFDRFRDKRAVGGATGTGGGAAGGGGGPGERNFRWPISLGPKGFSGGGPRWRFGGPGGGPAVHGRHFLGGPSEILWRSGHAYSATVFPTHGTKKNWEFLGPRGRTGRGGAPHGCPGLGPKKTRKNGGPKKNGGLWARGGFPEGGRGFGGGGRPNRRRAGAGAWGGGGPPEIFLDGEGPGNGSNRPPVGFRGGGGTWLGSRCAPTEKKPSVKKHPRGPHRGGWGGLSFRFI